jgi:hypothetical protein
LACRNPILPKTADDHRKAAQTLRRYVGRASGRLCSTLLHHHRGHDHWSVGVGAEVLDELSDILLGAKKRADKGELKVLQPLLQRTQWSPYHHEMTKTHKT